MAELDQIINEPSESEKRIKQLSDTAKTASEERDAARAEAEAAKAQAEAAQRERDNALAFADVLTAHPDAKDHREEILTKVNGGYTMEDATFAVLGKAGKLSVEPTSETVAGGSASTMAPSIGDKPISEMTQEERRAKLIEQFG